MLKKNKLLILLILFFFTKKTFNTDIKCFLKKPYLKEIGALLGVTLFGYILNKNIKYKSKQTDKSYFESLLEILSESIDKNLNN